MGNTTSQATLRGVALDLGRRPYPDNGDAWERILVSSTATVCQL